MFEDRLTKLTVGAIAFAWVYSLAAIGRIEGRVPQLPVAFAIAASLVSIWLFLRLVQRCSEGLRPVSVLAEITAETCALIAEVYPARFLADGGERAAPLLESGRAPKTISHRGLSGVVLAIDRMGLAASAVRADCSIEIVPMIGDFLASGDDLFRIHGAKLTGREEAALRNCIDLGPERTLTQDPAFGFRIIVDIAAKALSPGINDPTTAVLAIDQLRVLLHAIAHRRLDAAVVDRAGRPRLFCRTPDWEDFVTMAVTEIRLYGASSPQVTRRLRAMLETLLPIVPAQRRPALADQVARLQRTVERTYADPADRVHASLADTQGYGHPCSAGDAVIG